MSYIYVLYRKGSSTPIGIWTDKIKLGLILQASDHAARDYGVERYIDGSTKILTTAVSVDIESLIIESAQAQKDWLPRDMRVTDET